MNKRAILLPLLAAGVLVTGGLVAACGDDDGEDRPGVTIIGDGGPGSGSGSDSGSGTGVGPEPGVVEDPPDGATQVGVTLQEWSVIPDETTVEAGEIYFLVENSGPVDPHEFVIIRTNLEPGELPTDEGKVPEDEVDLIDEIEPFTPGSSASIAVNLEAGSYALICNIAEIEEGELESHYQLGMFTAFTVE